LLTTFLIFAMKILLIVLVQLVLSSNLYADVLRLSEPVQTDETSETFGAPITALPELTNITDLLTTPDSYQQQTFALAARVKKVCQKKGCFFIAQQDDQVIRVAFKDYSFFVPTDIGNRTVTLLGILNKRTLSEKEAAHLSADLGEQGSIQSGVLYEIIATSVRVDLSETPTSNHSIEMKADTDVQEKT